MHIVTVADGIVSIVIAF
jgi:hypothetical protein